MTALAIRYAPAAALSMPRIGAWSASITIHIVALLLLLSAPVAYKLVNAPPKEEPTYVRVIEEKTIRVVKDLEPPPPIAHHDKKAQRPTPPTPTQDFHEPTALSTVTDTPIAPPTLDAGPAVPPQPDTEPTAIAYGSHTSVPYPIESLKAREQGTVMLLVLVGVDGKVEDIRVEKSSGYFDGKVEDIRVEKSSGYARLDRAALNTVKLWNFNPARHGGAAQRAWAKVPISFTLSAL